MCPIPRARSVSTFLAPSSCFYCNEIAFSLPPPAPPAALGFQIVITIANFGRAAFVLKLYDEDFEVCHIWCSQLYGVTISSQATILVFIFKYLVFIVLSRSALSIVKPFARRRFVYFRDDLGANGVPTGAGAASPTSPRADSEGVAPASSDSTAAPGTDKSDLMIVGGGLGTVLPKTQIRKAFAEFVAADMPPR